LVKLYRGEAGKIEPLAGANVGGKKMQYLIPGLMLAIVIGGAIVAMRTLK